MPEPESPAESIERFAELIALDDDGDTPRAAIIAASGVVPATWRQIERSWIVRLAAGNDPDLAVRFGRAYGLTRLSFSNRAGAADVALEPAPPACAPTGGQLHPPPDDTLKDMLPGPDRGLASDAPEAAAEQATEAVPNAGASLALGEHSGTLVRRAADPDDTTLVCSLDEIPRDPLPFAPAVPPGKRLAYYDTRTGERLRTPVLVDLLPPQG